MEFSVNSPILFILVGAIIAVVLAQSFYFLIKAVKRAKQLGIAGSTVKKTIISSAVFTIAPAIAILVGVVALSKSLGIALPWLRLSIIGSITYETVAANNALQALGLEAGSQITDPNVYITVLWVMTIGIAAGLILVPFLTKKIQSGVNKIGMKDKKWGEIFNNAMFLGMISAFLGYVFCDVARLWDSGARQITEEILQDDGTVIEKVITVSATSGLIPVLVMLVSAVLMAICGIFAKKLKQGWMNDYALPISLVGGMASAIPITNWLA